ncbi:MAG: RNA-binding protein [Acidobacteriota bacterium]
MAESARRTTISSKVFVGNLNFQTTKDELSTYLAGAGEVVDVYLPTDRATGRPRGFAFVEFSSPEEAAQAIEQYNGTELAGRNLNINEAQDRPRRPPSGPRPPRQDFRPQAGDFADFGGGGGGFGGGGGGGGYKGNAGGGKPKGSRRGLRGRKRSL